MFSGRVASGCIMIHPSCGLTMNADQTSRRTYRQVIPDDVLDRTFARGQKTLRFDRGGVSARAVPADFDGREAGGRRPVATASSGAPGQDSVVVVEDLDGGRLL